MNNIKLSSENNTQLTISYELLYLLQWLIEHDDSRLKQMITKALALGLREEMQKTEKSNELVDEMCYQTIIDFFELMEELLAESIGEHIEKKAREKNLMPVIDQIDSTVCDDATMRFSIERTTTKIENDPDINPQEQLFKELLKSWQPPNKNIMN